MNTAWLVAGMIRQATPAASPPWNPAIVGGLAALLLLAIVGYVIWYLRREREQRYWVADMPTEIATSVGGGTRRGGGSAIAYLIAEDESLRLPKRIALEAVGEIRFGRDRSSCQVVLDDIGISRRHAVIRFRQGNFFLQDDNSRGGTYHQGKRLKPKEQAQLYHGSSVKFYTVAYRFLLADADTMVADADETVQTRHF